jgi:UDP-N-acetylglucosamine--N-acetylmuramyl-(pentapeptide) pyrophosphoryl-undecaprenol N-acetylglucosamine transferase
MPALWQAADVAICRSGATTVAELVAISLPAVLVPLPGAPGDHQTHNATALAHVGGAVVIADRDVSGLALSTTLSLWLTNSSALSQAEDGLRQLRHSGAASAIAAVIREVAHV